MKTTEMAEKKKIKFNKYDSKENYRNAVADTDVDNATFSVVRTPDCNANDNNANTGDVKDLYLYKTKLTDVYNSRMSGNPATSVTVGGLKAGTRLSELTNRSLGEVIDMMLFKTTYPTRTVAPGASLNYQQHWLVESEFPAVTTANISINQGRYDIEKDGKTVSAGVVSSGMQRFSATYSPSDRIMRGGNYTNRITVSVELKAGPTPKDSDGNYYTATTPYHIPYEGGTINITTDLYPYYNWYATGETVTSESAQEIDYTKAVVLKRQSATHHMGFRQITVMVDLGSGDRNSPQTIKVPGTISDCKTYLNGTWVDYAFTEIYSDPVTERLDNTTFFVYRMRPEMYNDGPVGGTRLRFKVNP